MSVTKPVACGKSCVQAGVVSGHTSIDPGCIWSKSSGDMITLAIPVTVPGDTAKPRRPFFSSSFCLIVAYGLLSFFNGGIALGCFIRKRWRRSLRRLFARSLSSGDIEVSVSVLIAADSSPLVR